MTLDEIAKRAAERWYGQSGIIHPDRLSTLALILKPFLAEAYEAGLKKGGEIMTTLCDSCKDKDRPVAPKRYWFEGQWWEEEVAVPRPPIEGEVYLFCDVAKRADHNFVSFYPIILRPVAPVE
ncbi:MAG: hypothetical protein WC356_04990, partial [Candidatus Micrarchaeia archaeon]